MATESASPSVKPSESGDISNAESGGNESDVDGSDISALKVEDHEDCKMACNHFLDFDTRFIVCQAFVVRNDLGMTSGKIAAQ